MRLYANGQWLNQSTFVWIYLCIAFWIKRRRKTVEKNRAVYVHGWMNEFMYINEHTNHPSRCIYACNSFSLSAHFPFSHSLIYCDQFGEKKRSSSKVIWTVCVHSNSVVKDFLLLFASLSSHSVLLETG